MNFIKQNAAVITLIGVAIIVFYVVKQSGGVSQLFSNPNEPKAVPVQ